MFFQHNEYRKRNLYPSLQFDGNSYASLLDNTTEVAYHSFDVDDEALIDIDTTRFGQIYRSRAPKMKTFAQIHQVNRLLYEASKLSNQADKPHCSRKMRKEKAEEKQKQEKSNNDERTHMQIFHDTLCNAQALANGDYLDNPEVFRNEILLQYNFATNDNEESLLAAKTPEKQMSRTNNNVRKRSAEASTIPEKDENFEPHTRKMQQENKSEIGEKSEIKILDTYEKSNGNDNKDESDKSKSEVEYEKMDEDTEAHTTKMQQENKSEIGEKSEIKILGRYEKSNENDNKDESDKSKSEVEYEIMDEDSQAHTTKMQQENESEIGEKSEVNGLCRYEKSNGNDNKDESDESESEDEYEKMDKTIDNERIMPTFSKKEIQDLQSYVQKYIRKNNKNFYKTVPPTKPPHSLWDWNYKLNRFLFSDDSQSE